MKKMHRVRLTRPRMDDISAVNCDHCDAFSPGNVEGLMPDFPSAKRHARKTGHTVQVTYEYSQTIAPVVEATPDAG